MYSPASWNCNLGADVVVLVNNKPVSCTCVNLISLPAPKRSIELSEPKCILSPDVIVLKVPVPVTDKLFKKHILPDCSKQPKVVAEENESALL